MLQHTYYTAVGHYLCKTDEAGRTYPVVICHQKEYSVDLQEMTLWTALNWRLLDRRQAEQQYQKLARDLIPTPPRSFDDCLSRLCLRGLAAEGKGETGVDALYDLFSDLYILPISRQALLSTAELVKCVENRVEDLSTDQKVLDALYGDTETTCDNIGFIMRSSKSVQAVVIAVSNLYLRQQILLERI